MIIYNCQRGRLGNGLYRLFASIVYCLVYKIDPLITCNINSYYTHTITDSFFETWMNNVLSELPVEKINENDNILFDGFYQHNKIYFKYKQQIIKYIQTHPNLQVKTDAKYNNKTYDVTQIMNMSLNKKYDIVIHLRLEDFIEISYAIHPQYIKNIIDKIMNEYPKYNICLVLNKPTTHIETMYIDFLKKISNRIVVESNDIITDFTIMKESKILVCSYSTICWSAAILSTYNEKIYMPHLIDVDNNNSYFFKSTESIHENTEWYDVTICSESELLNFLS